MKTRKRALPLILLILLAVAFTLSSCSLSFTNIDEAYINEPGELIIEYTTGTRDNLGVISGGGQGGSITINGSGTDSSLAASKAARSAVSVVCTLRNGNYSSGSGVIYKYVAEDDGYLIITNYHVVYDASQGILTDIDVLLYGSEYADNFIEAEYVGGSLNYDIAVLFIKSNDLIRNSGAAVVSVADSDMVCVGDTSIAIGNARGEGLSVTKGIVSVDSESIDMTAADNKTSVSFRVMRTDTPINKGNSGGGLFNDKGELIGIVNAKTILEGVEGIGYAIPSNLACNVADNIIDNCYGTYISTVQRALLGITVSISNPHSVYDQETGKIRIEEDVIVASVNNTSFLFGKLLENDIIRSISLDGHEEKIVTRQHHVIDYLLQARVGDTGNLVVEREDENGGTETITLSFTITQDHIANY